MDLFGDVAYMCRSAAQLPGSDKPERIQRVTLRESDPASGGGFNAPSFAVRFTNSNWGRLPRSLANFRRQNDKRREFLRGV
jgi:hypothetical protein